MVHHLNHSWREVLKDEFTKPYFLQLIEFLNHEYAIPEQRIFPPKDQVFAALNACAPDQVKVVIIGQDPYPTFGHANGLCFSLQPDVQPLARSLVNIFKEIEHDLKVQLPENGDLSRWANQGVLLLNTVLTVQEGMANSHKGKGWELFTDAVITYLSDNLTNCVFLLWGGHAHKKGKKIDRSKHFVLKSGHPSPLSANQGKWFGNKHFSQTNEFLIQNNIPPIIW